MIQDYFSLAVNSITHRKVRSWLTIVGIVIGIASIIALISLSLGLQSSIEEQFESFGPDRILISAKGFQGPGTVSFGLTEKDVETIEKISDIKVATPVAFRIGEVKFHDETKYPGIIGIPTKKASDYFESTTPLESGRNFRKNEKNSVMLGYRIAKKVFEDEIRVKNKIRINNKDFRVIGIFEEVGNQDNDNWIVIPFESFREIFKTGNAVDTISAQVKPGSDIPLTQKKIEKVLKRSRGDENFQVLTPTQILEQINQVLGVIQIVLVGIAAISLVVGGLGIMNSMYTSVLERTRDIGIMKSIGAKDSDILKIFLLESGLMGVVGGILGVTLGTLLSLGIAEYSTQTGFKLLVSINPLLMLFGLFFAFIVGIISGSLPAYRASMLNPIEALRHE